jgi:hypothetical protein
MSRKMAFNSRGLRRASFVSAAIVVIGGVVGIGSFSVAVVAAPHRSAASNDRAAGMYVEAQYAFARSAVRDVPAAHNAESEVVESATDGCSAVLRGAPEDSKTKMLEREVVAATTLAMKRAMRPAVRQFASAVRVLKWTSRAISRKIDEMATGRERYAALALPSLCDDAVAYARSEFRVLSVNTIRFDDAAASPRKLVVIAEGAGSLEGSIRDWLTRYESGRDVARARESELLLTKARRLLRREQPAWAEILRRWRFVVNPSGTVNATSRFEKEWF